VYARIEAQRYWATPRVAHGPNSLRPLYLPPFARRVPPHEHLALLLCVHELVLRHVAERTVRAQSPPFHRTCARRARRASEGPAPRPPLRSPVSITTRSSDGAELCNDGGPEAAAAAAATAVEATVVA